MAITYKEFTIPAGTQTGANVNGFDASTLEPIGVDELYRLTLATGTILSATGAGASGIVIRDRVETLYVHGTVFGASAAIIAGASSDAYTVRVITNGLSDITGGTYGVIFTGPGAHLLQNSSALTAGNGKGVAVLGTDAVETIVNTGHIRGRIELGGGNDVYTGGSGAMIGGIDSTVSLGAGNDSAVGGSANEFFDGGLGDDVINGGAGSDTAVFSGNASAAINLGLTGPQITGEGNDILIGIENLITGAGHDWLTGTASDNRFEAGAGNDHLIGLDGNDTLDGGSGNDVLEGGLGNDTYIVDSASDAVQDAGGSDTVIARYSYKLATGLENLTAHADAGGIGLTGNIAANAVTGNAFANRIDGGKGADTMKGGLGNDTYYVDTKSDRIFEARGEGKDRVYAGISYQLFADQEIEALIATGKKSIALKGSNTANAITGNAAKNVLVGFGGNDTLSGGSGNDQLYGGLDSDRLAGGKGRDAFVFDTKLDKVRNVDMVTDFRPVDDSFYLDNAIFRKLGSGSPSKPKKLKADAFWAGKKAHDPADRILYDKKTGALSYDADGTGKKAQPIKFAMLKKGLSLTEADLFVI